MARSLVMNLMPRTWASPVARVEQLQIKDAQESADVIRKIVGGQLDGPKRDIVLLNTLCRLGGGGQGTGLQGGLWPGPGID